ncbi:IS200/IS605 family transposase [Micromonospora purpureochromogenes]|uniref:IS200/IS605 family transposase n=1 Tax=Micromonospora purpureochromogenes TaxID=47872 RepID=UPI003401143C
MSDIDGIRAGRHCVFALHAHLVFVTKFRHKVFSDRHLTRMEEIMRAVCTDFDTDLIEFNGDDNHVHLLVNFPPKVAPSKLVNSLKGVSSRRMRQEFPDLARHYYQVNRLWSASYFAGSVGGPPLTILRQYIEQQNRPG